MIEIAFSYLLLLCLVCLIAGACFGQYAEKTEWLNAADRFDPVEKDGKVFIVHRKS